MDSWEIIPQTKGIQEHAKLVSIKDKAKLTLSLSENDKRQIIFKRGSVVTFKNKKANWNPEDVISDTTTE